MRAALRNAAAALALLQLALYASDCASAEQCTTGQAGDDHCAHILGAAAVCAAGTCTSRAEPASSTGSSGSFEAGGGGTSGSSSGRSNASSSGGPDGSSSGDQGPGLSCYHPELAHFRPGTGPLAAQNRCTTGQISDFLTACPGGLQNYDGGQPSCRTFYDANVVCGRCLCPEWDSTLVAADLANLPQGAYVFTDRVAWTTDNCEAALSAAGPACRTAYVHRADCVDFVCVACGTSVEPCREYAFSDDSVCAQLAPLDSTCKALVESATDGAAGPGCNSLQAVATTLCGP